MKNEIIIRFSGEQGSGVQYTGQLFASYLTNLNLNIFCVNEFESRIRGGYSFAQLRIGNKDINSIKKIPDVNIALTKSSVKSDLKTANGETVFILDKDFSDEIPDRLNTFFIDFATMFENKRVLSFKNTFYVGLIAGLLKLDEEILVEELKSSLSKKDEMVISNNLVILKKGFNYSGSVGGILKDYNLKTDTSEKRNEKAVSGSFCVSLGIVASNCKFYCAYPMSPSTAIITQLSNWSKKTGIMVEQGEDEISVLNIALGASFAGVRSMVGTSGGGLALMSETVSLAAISEVPIVILNAQRPAPATGLPTRTEQGDLLFTLNLGHGEFSRIILAPSTHESAYELTQKAFYLADKYQVPVFILTDQYIMDSIRNFKKNPINKKYHERFIDDNDDNLNYLRYQFTENGVSKRKVPGFSKDPVIADSHTHEESGFITEDENLRVSGVDKLLKKKAFILNDIAPPYLSSSKDEKNIVIGWGSTFGVIFDAVNTLTKLGLSINHVHYNEVYPLSLEGVKEKFKTCKNIIVVEQNATGQFAQILKLEADINVDETILKYNGRPLYLDELVKKLEVRLLK